MAPKKKDNTSKKDKKKKNKDGSTIAAGLIPNTVFAAVPKTPPPSATPTLRDSYDLELSTGTGVLRASAMGRMFSTPPPDDFLSEETDTSLYDYEQARGTLSLSATLLNSSTVPRMMAIPTPGASSDGQGTSRSRRTEYPLSDTDTSLYELEQAVVMQHKQQSGAGGTGSLRRSMGDRPPAPPPGFNDTSDDEQQGYNDPMYSEVRVEREISPAYATPMKQARKSASFREDSDEDSSPPPQSSLRRFTEDDTAQLRGSRGSRPGSRQGSRQGSLRGSLRGSYEEKIEAYAMSQQHLTQSGSLRNSGRDLSHASSAKMASLSEKDRSLKSEQRTLEREVEQDQNSQQQVMQKMATQQLAMSMNPEDTANTDIATLLQETHSVTERSNRSQAELMNTFKQRIEVLEKSNKELTDLNEQLQGEVNSVRRMASFREGMDDHVSSQTGLYKKQLQDLRDESTTLKATVHRLNTEISRYQAQFRTLTDKERDDLPGLPMRGPKPSWLLNTKLLAPLFVAYDDRLAQKDEMLRQYERDIDTFTSKIEDVLKENQRLHLRIENSDVHGPNSMTEWRQLQEQCKLVLEENQLLMEQLDMQHDKQRDMHHAHVQEVTRLSKQIVEVESSRTVVEREIEILRREHTVMKETHEAVVESKAKLVGTKTAEELARELEEEQLLHRQNVANLQNRLETLTSEKKSLEIQVSDLKTENKSMNGDLKALYKAQRKSHRKILLLQKALEDAESKEHTAEHYLSSVVKMAQKTEQERDTYAHAAHKQTKEKKKAISRLIEENSTVGKMEEKLKIYKVKVVEKLEHAQVRLQEQDETFNMQRQEYEREIKHLRLLLREKDDQLDQTTGEKKRVEDDLETMWQVASKDNRQMKETLRKSIRKLQTHEGLRHVDEDSEMLLKDAGDELYRTVMEEKA